MEQRISPPVNFCHCSRYILKNQPIFHYYYINIMSVHKCTHFRTQKIWHLLTAHFYVNSPKKNMMAATLVSKFSNRHKTWVFGNFFEVCKSSGNSSSIWLLDGDKKKGHWTIPCDPTVILRGSVPVNPLFAHKFLLVYSFLNISPIIFHQSWISWSFLNAEFPEKFKTGISFKIWAEINGENWVQSHGRRNLLFHPLVIYLS